MRLIVPTAPTVGGRSGVGHGRVGGEVRDDLRVSGDLVADVAAVAARRDGDGRVGDGEADGVAAQVQLVKDLLEMITRLVALCCLT